MGNLVNISGGGVQAPDTFSPPVAISGLSFGANITGDWDSLTNSPYAGTATSYFIPIYIPTTRNVDAFVIVAGTGNLTNDIEFGLYNIDTTSFQTGSKIVGATLTSTLTASTYTEITFTPTEVPEGWLYVGFSGISAVAPPDLSSWQTSAGTNQKTYPNLGFGVDDTGGAGLNKIGTFQASAQIASIGTGQALTTGAGIENMPFLRLRNA